MKWKVAFAFRADFFGFLCSHTDVIAQLFLNMVEEWIWYGRVLFHLYLKILSKA